MRAITLLFLLGLFVFPGCDRSMSVLDDLSWGQTFEADYQALLQRTRFILLRRFPLGFDPDRTEEKTGEFWTVWKYNMAQYYRDSTRVRAHVKVDDLGDGKVRIGTAVVRQVNDNIDNPSVKEEARWVSTTRDTEWGARLEQAIARRYLKVDGSALWKEKHREKKRGTMRPDILDRSKDVDMDDLDPIDDPDKEPPASTGPEKHKDGKR